MPSGQAVRLLVGRSAYTDQIGITAEGLSHGAYRLVSGDDWLVFPGDDTEFVPREPWARNHAGIVSGELQEAWLVPRCGPVWLLPAVRREPVQLPHEHLLAADGQVPPGLLVTDLAQIQEIELLGRGAD